MVPPPARDDDNNTDRLMKSPAFLRGVMRPLQELFQRSRFLSALSLGQLGNLIEFTIHGWMHVRWTQTIYDATSGEAIGRSSLFDINPEWDDPSNDDLGDFYSSHVHPIFWRLHGWVDDRINDWARVNAPRIKTATIDGVSWFAADGQLVQVSDPFYWPSHGHHHEPEEGDVDVRVMEEVMSIMKGVIEQPEAVTRALQMPAKLAFRELLLGINVPEVSQ
jgi:hypothetical protein